MSMALHSLPEVYHSSWIFGHRNDYVITLSRDNLNQLLDLGTAARQEFTSAPPR